jgi:hypothetical protein
MSIGIPHCPANSQVSFILDGDGDQNKVGWKAFRQKNPLHWTGDFV